MQAKDLEERRKYRTRDGDYIALTLLGGDGEQQPPVQLMDVELIYDERVGDQYRFTVNGRKYFTTDADEFDRIEPIGETSTAADLEGLQRRAKQWQDYERWALQ